MLSTGDEEMLSLEKIHPLSQASPSVFGHYVHGELGVFAFSLDSTSKVKALKKGLGPNHANPSKWEAVMEAVLLASGGRAWQVLYVGTTGTARSASVHTTTRAKFQVTLSPETNFEGKTYFLFF